MIDPTSWVDTKIHLGDLILSPFLALIGYGLRRTYVAIRAFLDRVAHMDTRLDKHEEVIDIHSDILEAFLAGTRHIPRVRSRRE